MTIPSQSLLTRAQSIAKKIAVASALSGRDFGAVEMVIAGKYATVEELAPLVAAGFNTIGENRVQSALDKQPQLPGVSWHMIGHLQSNKVKKAVALFDVIESVDSLKLLELLNQEASSFGQPLSIYLQINVAGESGKGGFALRETRSVMTAALKLPSLVVRGLMTMPPYVSDPEQSRPVFRQLRELRDTLGQDFGLPDLALSMGTSQDYGVAIEEGATQVRIGRALFAGDGVNQNQE